MAVEAIDVIQLMDGWSDVRVDKYEFDAGTYVTAWTGDAGCMSDLPDDLKNLEVEQIHIYGNTLVLEVDG